MKIISTILFLFIFSFKSYSQSLEKDANYFYRYYKGTFQNLKNAPDNLYEGKNTIYIFGESKSIWILRNIGKRDPLVTKIKLHKDVWEQSNSTWIEGTVTEGTERGKDVIVILYKGLTGIQVVYNSNLKSSSHHLEKVAIREIFM